MVGCNRMSYVVFNQRHATLWASEPSFFCQSLTLLKNTGLRPFSPFYRRKVRPCPMLLSSDGLPVEATNHSLVFMFSTVAYICHVCTRR